MDTTNQPSSILNPRSSIDVAAIERDLTALWKDAGEEDGEGGVIRACVLNLLVYVPDLAASREVDELLAEISAAHPSRAILMVADGEAEGSSIGAWVTSRCTLPTASSKQVCCEQVTVVAAGEQVNEVPSAVVPLLLSDLPVYLWWRAVPPLANRVFRRLVDISDRVVIDSATFADPHGDLLSLAVLLRDSPRWAAFSDLNWARLTPWRALLAGFYDVADYRGPLARLGRIVIEHAPPEAQPEALSPRALLVAGWLASRLRWPLAEAAVRGEGGRTIFEMGPPERGLRLEFVPTGDRALAPGHLARVTFETGDSGAASFSVKKVGDGSRLETEVLLGGERRGGRVLGYDDRGESALIASELEILGHDRVYEQAVVAAGEMVLAVVQA